MEELIPDKRLFKCLALVQRSYELHLDQAERSSEAEVVFMEYHAACSRYHQALPPVPDSDQSAPGLVKANPQNCIEEIVHRLSPLYDKSRKLQKYKREFIKVFGDWTFSTHVQIWLKDGMVHGYSFLRRRDSEPHHWGGEWSSRIDPLMHLGVSTTNFPEVTSLFQAT
jgi:hypothetical protein